MQRASAFLILQDETYSVRVLDLSLQAQRQTHFPIPLPTYPALRPNPLVVPSISTSHTSLLFPEWLLLPSPVSIEKMLHSIIFLKRRSVWLEDKCVCLFFPALGSLQPVRADLIQEGSNSDFLIPPWKKCLAHSGCRVLSLRGEAAPLRKGTEFREEPQAFASAVSKGRSAVDVRAVPSCFAGTLAINILFGSSLATSGKNWWY